MEIGVWLTIWTCSRLCGLPPVPQVVEDGYEFFAQRQLVTLFSAVSRVPRRSWHAFFLLRELSFQSLEARVKPAFSATSLLFISRFLFSPRLSGTAKLLRRV